MPLVDPGGSGLDATAPLPPEEGYYDDGDRPEAHYVWRWVTYQAPDAVLVVGPGANDAGSVESTLADALAARERLEGARAYAYYKARLSRTCPIPEGAPLSN